MLIIVIMFYTLFTLNFSIANESLNNIVDWEQIKEMTEKKDYQKKLLKYDSIIFNLKNNIYEIREDGLYKKNSSSISEKILNEKFKIDFISRKFTLLKIDNILYLVDYFASEASYNFSIIVLNEEEKNYYRFDPPNECYFQKNIFFVEDKKLNIVCANSDIDADPNESLKIIQLLDKEINFIKNNLNIQFVLNEKNEDSYQYNKLEILNKNDDKIKIIEEKDWITGNFVEKETRKSYNQKCAYMYDNYYYIKNLIKNFGECGDIPFEELDLEYGIIILEPEEKNSFFEICENETKNDKILDIDNYCKKLTNN